jgi:hypothetical protein
VTTIPLEEEDREGLEEVSDHHVSDEIGTVIAQLVVTEIDLFQVL